MQEKKIQSILREALEEEIPSSQIDLWPTVNDNLVAGKQDQFQQGGKMPAINLHRTRWLVYAILIMAFLAVLIFATPQGRSFAQSVLLFFTRAESITFPVASTQIEAVEPDQPLPTVGPPSPLVSVAEAEAKTSFEVAELPFVPDGLNYLGARLYGNAVSLEYETQGMIGHLIIMQSREGFYQSDWDSVPSDAIIPVKIGDLDGEYTQGTFVIYAGDTSATWNPGAPIQRLRWVKDGVWFEMTKNGYAKEIDYLDQSGLINLAESLEIK
jgi:hypothetical protein